MGIEHGDREVLLRERIVARVAVFIALRLARCNPKRIQRVLHVVRIGAKPANYAQTSRARAVVTSTSLACAGREGCLPRSIATVLLTRVHGVVPVWVVGVRATPPFGAHAWVQAEGRDVGEPHPPGYYAPLLTVEPG
ncbi:lasso peptide biosynthesis B2 protein [Gordonia sp. ABSL11-1]|uniref:lasso peptide biosynthesis B2 protein n=1 Tax=Gordonia sp. ABSL11-1 TaxID=3053924 RepID=UPI0033653277